MRLIDVDEVVEQLEELKEEDVCMNISCVLCKYKPECHPDCYADQKVAIDRAIEIVESAEGSKEKSGWIPISERLPEPGKYVLMRFKNFYLPKVGTYEIAEEGGGEFYMADDAECCTYGLYVDAWLPLPEPYGEVRR